MSVYKSDTPPNRFGRANYAFLERVELMNKRLIATALLMAGLSMPAFAADTPATPAPAADAKPMAKPMMKKPMPMKAMPVKASAKIKPAREPSTDKLNQQQLDSLKSS